MLFDMQGFSNGVNLLFLLFPFHSQQKAHGVAEQMAMLCLYFD